MDGELGCCRVTWWGPNTFRGSVGKGLLCAKLQARRELGAGGDRRPERLEGRQRWGRGQARLQCGPVSTPCTGSPLRAPGGGLRTLTGLCEPQPPPEPMPRGSQDWPRGTHLLQAALHAQGPSQPSRVPRASLPSCEAATSRVNGVSLNLGEATAEGMPRPPAERASSFQFKENSCE